jgi:hypothetical protein
MRLYAGSSADFITATTHRAIVGLLKQAYFEQYRDQAREGEILSWQNSLQAVSEVFQQAGLLDHGVLLEYQLPLTSKRLDCLICGNDARQEPRAVIIELKQWSKTEPSAGRHEVVTWLDGAKKDVLHPSAQVGLYRSYLREVHTAFNGEQDRIKLHACSYLHNYHFGTTDAVLDPKFDQLLESYPVFGQPQRQELGNFLQRRLGGGQGAGPLRRIEQGKYAPSKKLLDHVVSLIDTDASYVLLDEQMLVYDQVFAAIVAAQESRQKTAILVKGGPGTGKSVVALNLLAELMRQGYQAHYATGSQAFTETLRDKFGPRGRSFFTYFNAYATTAENALHVLLCDEAHRIRSSSVDRFTSASQRSGLNQVQELLRAAMVTVFFIDDFQRVRPGEIGSYDMLRQEAERAGAVVKEHELEAQFRCSGSSGFINWLDNTLGIRRTANVLWGTGEGYDFQILPTPMAVEELLQQQLQAGYTARMVAGFCWPWSEPTDEGFLVEDVVIEQPGISYRRPWNAKSTKKRLAAGIPKSSLWATQPGGFNQVGCVFTAQGFEFDYVGVIVGRDLTYRFARQTWVANSQATHDKSLKQSRLTDQERVEFFRNTYKVLMTRGMKGCYVYFEDEETGQFFRSRMEA